MKFTENGYITELSSVEAIQILQPYFENVCAARGNTKPVLTANLLTAWSQIYKDIMGVSYENL